MKKINYKTFTLKNYADIYQFWQSMPEIVLTKSDHLKEMKGFLKRNPNFSFLAFCEKKVVGTLLSGHDGRRGFFYHLAVHPDYRNQGIGKQLVKLALEKMKKIQIERIHLFILRTNHSGKEFWEKMGFDKRDDIEIMSIKLQ